MAGWWQEWWVWGAAALVLAILEVILPGYVFLGFAIGALVLAGVQLIGLTGLSLPVSLVIFALLSLAAYLVLRKLFALEHGTKTLWDRDINDN